MERQPFITRELSIALDLVRGLAALIVMIGHAMQLGFYTGPGQFPSTVQHQAVVVFFVLSGLVIAHSTRGRSEGLSQFALARISRIVPTAWLALAVSALAYAIAGSLGGPPVPQPADNAAFSLTGAVLSALFLSEGWIGTGPVWNPPYWSLCYEMWYYALFAAWTFAPPRQRWLWVLPLAVLAGPKILLLMPAWLIGAWLAGWHETQAQSLTTAAFRIVAGAALVVLVGLDPYFSSAVFRHFFGTDFGTMEFSSYPISDLVTGLGVAFVFIGLRRVTEAFSAPMLASARPARFMADMSFVLYVLHWPLLCLMLALGWSAGDQPALLIAAAAGLITLSHFTAKAIDSRRAGLRKWLEALVDKAARRRPALSA